MSAQPMTMRVLMFVTGASWAAATFELQQYEIEWNVKFNNTKSNE